MADAMTESPDNETEERPNDVVIENVGPARKKVTITIPAETINEKIDDSFTALISESALPGFRRGRAPKRLIEKKFGTEVRQETKNQVIADAYTKVIEEHNLQPVGDPEPDDELGELELEENKPLTFSFFVEVAPEFDLPDLSKIEIKKPTLEITDEHVENELKRQCRQLGSADPIESDFQPGDHLIGSADVFKNDETEVFFRNDETIVVAPGKDNKGQGQVLGLLIDGLAKKIAGSKVNDVLSIETVGPEGHENEEIRGARLRIEFKIDRAERIIPAPIERVIEYYSLGTEENLREQVRIVLNQRMLSEQATAMREQLYEQLLKMVDFELPEKLTAAQAQRTIERQRLELLYRGVSVEEVEDRLAQMRSASLENARNTLKLTFVLQRLAREFDIDVTEQEINARISSMAMQRGERPAQLRAELSRIGRLGMVRQQVLEHKAADYALRKTSIKEVSAEEWNARTKK